MLPFTSVTAPSSAHKLKLSDDYNDYLNESNSSVFKVYTTRLSLLCCLLLFQSTSSIILERYMKLLQKYPEITMFLTMVVGAGGNASNQSAVEMIRGIAVGKISINYAQISVVLFKEFKVALLLGVSLFFLGIFRVFLSLTYFNDDFVAAMPSASILISSPAMISLAISISLLLIVVSSVMMGIIVPLGLYMARIDPGRIFLFLL